MGVIKLPGKGGSVVTLGPQAEADQQKAVLAARYTFVLKYCREKGWPEDLEELSLGQISEICAQEGWKNP